MNDPLGNISTCNQRTFFIKIILYDFKEEYCLNGITRSKLFIYVKNNISCLEKDFKFNAIRLRRRNSIGTFAGIIPVSRIENKNYRQ